MMRLIGKLIIAVICLNCQNQHDGIKGHWVSIDYLNNREYVTLDIYDSIAIDNQNGLHPWQCQITFEDGEFIGLPISCSHDYISTKKFIVSNDRLIITDTLWPSYITPMFIRIDDSQVGFRHLFSESSVIVDLDTLRSYDFEVGSFRRSTIANLNIGRPKCRYWEHDFEVLHSQNDRNDSFHIESDNRFIRLEDLKSWLRLQQDMLDYQDTVKVCLNADRDVPEEQVQMIIDSLVAGTGNFRLMKAGFNLNEQGRVLKEIK